MWLDESSFLVSGVDGKHLLMQPRLYGIDGKRTGGMSAYVIADGAIDGGKTFWALGDPEKLEEPIEAGSLGKNGRMLVMDMDSKVLTKIDGRQAGLSQNGKYVAISSQMATSQPATMGSEPTITVFSTEGKEGAKLSGWMGAVRVTDTGELLGVTRDMEHREKGGSLLSCAADGRSSVLLENVVTVALQDETLYYILADSPQVIRAVKFSRLGK